MNHWLKNVSIVQLDPQAMLTIRLPILSKNIIHYESGERLGPWASCLVYYSIHDCLSQSTDIRIN